MSASVPCQTSALSSAMRLLWESHSDDTAFRMGKQYEYPRRDVRGLACLRRQVVDDPAVEEIDAPFRAGDVVRVVRGEADRGAAGVQLVEHLHDPFAALR